MQDKAQRTHCNCKGVHVKK